MNIRNTKVPYRIVAFHRVPEIEELSPKPEYSDVQLNCPSDFH